MDTIKFFGEFRAGIFAGGYGVFAGEYGLFGRMPPVADGVRVVFRKHYLAEKKHYLEFQKSVFAEKF